MEQTYRLVPEAEIQQLLSALKAACELLERRAGTATLPPGQTASRFTRFKGGNTRNTPKRDFSAGLQKAREVMDRVSKGGALHVPKPFDATGPRISDFIAMLVTGEFTTVEALEKIKKYVALKQNRRDATSQVRNALRLDEDRFEKTNDGRWRKIA
jgi:hypothetical protein